MPPFSKNHIFSVMVNVFASSAVGQVKPKTIKFDLYVLLLR